MSKKTYLIDGRKSGLIGLSSDWDHESLYGDFDDDEFDDDTDLLMVKGRTEALQMAKRLCDDHSPFALNEGDEYRISYQVFVREDRGNGGVMLYRIGGYERVIMG